MVALLAFEIVNIAVSFASSKVSTNTGTLNVALVAPAAMVSVPEAAV